MTFLASIMGPKETTSLPLWQIDKQPMNLRQLFIFYTVTQYSSITSSFYFIISTKSNLIYLDKNIRNFLKKWGYTVKFL